MKRLKSELIVRSSVDAALPAWIRPPYRVRVFAGEQFLLEWPQDCESGSYRRRNPGGRVGRLAARYCAMAALAKSV